MWYDYPTKEDYELKVNINVSWTNQTILIKYEQATIQETLELVKYLDDWWTTDDRVMDFVKNNSDINKVQSGILKLWPELRMKIWNKIKHTRFKNTFSDSEDKAGEDGHPYWYVLAQLCGKNLYYVDDFQRKYTVEQLWYLWEALVYTSNEEAGEEWQKKNERNRFDKKHSDEDLLDLIS